MKLKYPAILDPGFQPMSLLLREFEAQVKASPSQKLLVALERHNGYRERFDFDILADGVDDARNCAVAERVVKTLLWVFGGWKISVCGSRAVYEHLRDAYRPGGLRAFDEQFMSRVYERPFEVAWVDAPETMPEPRHSASAVGRHLGGCRIGFDAGGSDRKVSAVIDGEAVYSEEVVWHPKTQSDPEYHFQGILDSFRTAASKMPRVDAIGVSTAGVTIGNRILVASLFLKVSDEDFDRRVKSIYLDAARELGENIPIEVANDGDVTALAPAAGIELDEGLTPAEKLKVVQELMEKGDPRAARIYETIGTYFGYALAYYARFYDFRHALIMGRVTSGEGGVILLDRAREVLRGEFPELANKIELNIPDESSRRVGQSIAAASLAQ